ncbi:uncharacterized protein BO95DRAFT_437884 [Aspergillus brunneoviolaceus CBS 621.78]|uniref:Uncharacterized protein n=1 Tax=Aspergillus brunneoviolaceus CBS 621.78 TaxID=1450534 RepID=A0ACD1GPN3_9EURO|nr:hypothetical protein BO95DRAFT_437884 [Aspergillus brunneoviolaceus CBS 621.78]RAH51078.1 hypothetical protein BO95DRAFT_437884 [Aspergillus brunneoviolaceus CBS 621.78]
MDAAALLCKICPKRPTFSDVSHLLTHVASKAHLSHYFKLQVRSHQEQQAVDLLDEYDHWYKTNNLGRLLSDRMSSKEARKKKTSTKPTTHAEVKVEKPDVALSVLPLIHNPFPDYIDPRLADTYIEQPLELAHAGSTSASYVTRTDPSAQTCQSYSHTMHGSDSRDTEYELWKREPRGDVIAYDDGFSVMPYCTSPREDRMVTGTNTMNRGYRSDPFLDESESIDWPVSDLLDKERADEMARLKGILWPGMDIFDSATEQMRRRRNQKKDESILRMMEKTSLCVEPTELVFSPTGILRKQRVISGNVEDSSPLKGETPIPKRRVSRPKRVLSQLDANINRRQHGPNKKKNKKAERQGVECMGEHWTQSATQTRQGQVSIYRRSCADDQAKSVPKRRSGLKDRNEFAVYRDEEGQHRRSSRNQHISGGLSYAASAVSHPIFLLREYTPRTDECASRSATHLSAFTERTADETMDKENIEPLFNACGRIDPGVGWRSPAMKQHLANDIGYPPQLFYQNAQSAGLSPFGGHDSPAGYHYNPLSVSLGRLPVEEAQLSTLNSQAGADYKARPESPEGTISDAEEGEFERLYLPGSSC